MVRTSSGRLCNSFSAKKDAEGGSQKSSQVMISLINKNMDTPSYSLSGNASNTTETAQQLLEGKQLSPLVERSETDEDVATTEKLCEESDNVCLEENVKSDAIIVQERKNSNSDSIKDIDDIEQMDNVIVSEEFVNNVPFSNKHPQREIGAADLTCEDKPGLNFNVLKIPGDVDLNKNSDVVDIKSNIAPKFEESYHNLAKEQLEASRSEVQARRISREVLSPDAFLHRCKYGPQMSSPANINIDRKDAGVVSGLKVLSRKPSSSVVEIDEATDSVSILEHLARSLHEDPHYEEQMQSRILNSFPTVSIADGPATCAASASSVHAKSSSEPCEGLCVEHLPRPSGLKRNVSLPLGVDFNTFEDAARKKRKRRRKKKRRKKSKGSDVEALHGRHNIAAQERRKMVVVVSVFAAAIFLTAVLLIIISLHMSQNINAKDEVPKDVPKTRPRKLSAPELSRSSSKKSQKKLMYTNSYLQPQVHQKLRRMSSVNVTPDSQCVDFCHCCLDDGPPLCPLDEFLLLHRQPDKDLAHPLVIIHSANCPRRRSENYTGEVELSDLLKVKRVPSQRLLSTPTRSSSRSRRPSNASSVKSRRSSGREAQTTSRQLSVVTLARQISTTSDVSSCNSVGTRRISLDPELDSVNSKSRITDEESEKRRRLIVSVFSIFVMLLFALAVLMISATLSIQYGKKNVTRDRS